MDDSKSIIENFINEYNELKNKIEYLDNENKQLKEKENRLCSIFVEPLLKYLVECELPSDEESINNLLDQISFVYFNNVESNKDIIKWTLIYNR